MNNLAQNPVINNQPNNDQTKDMQPVLMVKNLTKHYHGRTAPAINNISFNVYPGQFHAFVGANGAGKTTTIKSIVGAYAKWNGQILINGEKNTTSQAKLKLGYIPEKANFPSKMNVYKYLSWMAALSGFSFKQANKFATEILQELNLWQLRFKSPNTFSSGQKKKVLLAQALVSNPDVLVMDEPAANLDPQARLEFFDKLKKLTSQNKAVFISSHILAEIEKYANAVTILDGGKIIYSGSMEQLVKQNQSQQQINFASANPEQDNQKIIAFLTKNKYVYQFDQAKNNFLINDPKNDLKKKLLDFVLKNDIEYKDLSLHQSDLSDLYSKLIKHGSVDTMQAKKTI